MPEKLWVRAWDRRLIFLWELPARRASLIALSFLLFVSRQNQVKTGIAGGVDRAQTNTYREVLFIITAASFQAQRPAAHASSHSTLRGSPAMPTHTPTPL